MAKYGTFIMIAVWIAIIYFFMILPNKKKQKKQKDMMRKKDGFTVHFQKNAVAVIMPG